MQKNLVFNGILERGMVGIVRAGSPDAAGDARLGDLHRRLRRVGAHDAHHAAFKNALKNCLLQHAVAPDRLVKLVMH